ncbi:hypothetical protein POX_f07992 [Penicillium oxalicum]|uniref:Transcription initiation factor Rrn11 n=1 Tax=Penicillium oxalicum (strain 114-2 / CGMCC 5302) TaxID=933388 RepID=S8AS92_PENO1|nr:hypothetical protein POX_f07992 [Penicillium oxalicum]EPS28918.1 hypothetical protein PDE_03864 [Penicillium oxalicum 114-2]KAI2787619.1 hypothetical protein POX_f07992 [Penicillium oxalicum]
MAPALSASFFSLPLPSWLQPTSTRVAQYDRRKRKKSNDWTDEEVDGAYTTDATSAGESAVAGPALVLTPNESHQYRVAGLTFDQELPGGNFPHGPPRNEQSPGESKKLLSHHLRNLSTLRDPVYPPQSAAHQGTIRLQHLSVLTAILHKCLLQRDYVRAGRAWGLILREEFHGFSVDVRSEGRWGVGAEILLRRGQQEMSQPASDARDDASSTKERAVLSFTRKGFEEAKEYYERLILNHPYSKSAPHAVSALTFYPAMFGLWIYVVQEESQVARRNLATESEDSSDELSGDDMSSVDLERRPSSVKATLVADIRKRELEEAQRIATRMDMLLGTPPYSDSAELLELRGMVSLWIADLLVSSLEALPETSHHDDSEMMLTDHLPTDLGARRRYRLALERKEKERRKADAFLEKSQKRARGVAYNLEHLHLEEDLHSD